MIWIGTKKDFVSKALDRVMGDKVIKQILPQIEMIKNAECISNEALKEMKSLTLSNDAINSIINEHREIKQIKDDLPEELKIDLENIIEQLLKNIKKTSNIRKFAENYDRLLYILNNINNNIKDIEILSCQLIKQKNTYEIELCIRNYTSSTINKCTAFLNILTIEDNVKKLLETRKIEQEIYLEPYTEYTFKEKIELDKHYKDIQTKIMKYEII